MTTIRQLCTAALREGGIISVDDTPDSANLTEAQDRLTNIIDQLLNNVLAIRLQDVTYGDDGVSNPFGQCADQSGIIDSSYVPSNVRLVCNLSGPKTVYLNPRPKDGDVVFVSDNAGNFATHNLTVDGNGRKVNSGTTLIANTNGYAAFLFYRADLTSWMPVPGSFAIDDPSPFPGAFDDLLITALAIRLNPRYGAETHQETVAIHDSLRKLFRARYRQFQEMPSEEALLRTTLRRNRGTSIPGSFNQGYDDPGDLAGML